MVTKYSRKTRMKKLTRSIRIPIILDERIKELSQKNLTSYNAWVMSTLISKAYKHDSNMRHQLLGKDGLNKD